MPFHLPPVRHSASRRAFLLTSAVGGITVLTQRVFGAGAAGPAAASHWALMSDTHIDADAATEARGAVMAANLERVREEILGHSDRFEAGFLNGDCAYLSGLPGDYATLGGLLKPFSEAGLPLHFNMGNHDDRGPFCEAFAAQRPESPPVEGKHVTVLETPLVNWFLVDSLQRVNNVTGEIGEAQREWLARALDERPDKPAIVMGHHNLQETPGEKNGKPYVTGIEDTLAFRDLLVARRQVKAYVFGHTHNWSLSQPEHMAGLHLINLPPVAYVFDAARPNGWTHATVREEGLTLTLRALDKSHPEHGVVKELAWRAG